MTISFDRRVAFRGQVAFAALFFAAALALSPSFSHEIPTAGIVTNGQASIITHDGWLNVTQNSQTAIISWETFSVGAGGHAHFENGNGATLNRVRGNVASQINGRLTATGSLYLINPNGITVGQNGTVETGGSFVGTTLDLTDEEFAKAAAGDAYTLAGSSNATIVNAGKIGSLGGDVVLAAREVENHGDIEATSGAVGLLAGSEVLIKDRNSHDGRFLVKSRSADTSVTNTGSIKAVEIELRANGGNVYALAGNRGGIITATGSETRNGRIFLTADEGEGVDRGRVEATGKLNARRPSQRAGAAFDGGRIQVKARSVRISGQLNAHGSVAAANPGTLPPPRPGHPLLNGDGGTIKVSSRWQDSDFTGATFNVVGVTAGSYNLALEGRPPGEQLPDLTPPPHEEPEPILEPPPPAEKPKRPPIIVPPPAEPPPAEEPAPVVPAPVEPPPAPPAEEPAPPPPAPQPPAKENAAAETPAPAPVTPPTEDRADDPAEQPAPALPVPSRPDTAAAKDVDPVVTDRQIARQDAEEVGQAAPDSVEVDATPAAMSEPAPAIRPATATLARGECSAATPRLTDADDAAGALSAGILQTICNVELQHTARQQQGH